MIPLKDNVIAGGGSSSLVYIQFYRTMVPSAVRSFPELCEIIARTGIVATYLFVGNGAKLQYKDMDAVRQCLGEFGETLETKHGHGRWLGVYGGDTFIEKSPDLGAAMHFLKSRFSLPLLAVQGWDEVDDFVDYLWRYPEEKDGNGRTLYGGVRDGNIVGGTKVYLGPDFKSILTGMVSIDAQGRVGVQEVEYARRQGVPLIELGPLLPKNSY